MIQLYLWECEVQGRAITWVMDYWPLFCPICGKAVHPQLSTHHSMGREIPDTEDRPRYNADGDLVPEGDTTEEGEW